MSEFAVESTPNENSELVCTDAPDPRFLSIPETRTLVMNFPGLAPLFEEG